MSAEALLMKLKRRVLVRSLKGGLVSPRGCSLFSELRGRPRIVTYVILQLCGGRSFGRQPGGCGDLIFVPNFLNQISNFL